MAQQDSGLRLLGLIGGALAVWFCSYIVALLGLNAEPAGALASGGLVVLAVVGFLPWIWTSVFDFMMDFGRASRWRNLVRKIEVLTPGPVREGSELAVTFDVMGKVRTTTSEVWAFERPRRLGLRNTANNVTGVFEYTLEPHDGGTTVRFMCDIKPHGLMWLALPFLIRGNRMRYRDQLSNLGRAIEDGWPA